MTLYLTEGLRSGWIDNRFGRDTVFARFVFQRQTGMLPADIATQAGYADPGFVVPLEVCFTLRSNLPRPFKCNALRIKNPGPMVSDPPFFEDFPDNHLGYVVESEFVDECLHFSWKGKNPADELHVQLEVPASWLTEVC